MQLQQQTEATNSQGTTWPKPELSNTLAQDAQSRDSAVRQSALRALQQQGVEGIEPLLELFRTEMRGQLRRKRLRRLMGRVAVGSCGAYCTFCLNSVLAL